MASWFGSLASNVESLLDRVDQAAGETFVKDAEALPTYFDDEGNVLPAESQLPKTFTARSSYTPPPTVVGRPFTSVQMDYEPEKMWSPRPSKFTVPENSSTPAITVSKNKSIPASKDLDQELFEFLNNADVPDPSSSGVGARIESRSPSASSSVSARSRKTPEGSSVEGIVNSSGFVRPPEIMRNSSSTEVGTSPVEMVQSHQTNNAFELEQENHLLKNEISSLNHELQLHAQRLRTSQQEVTRLQRQLETAKSHQVAGDQTAGELRRRDADNREALAAKDAQIAVLRTRLEEADLELDSRKRQLNELQSTDDKSRDEQSSTSVIHRHVLDGMQEKLNDAEVALRHEREERHRENEESIRCRNRLEVEKQNLVEEVGSLQKSLNKEKTRNAEFSALMKGAHTQAEAAKQELSDYREKAMRILQSKEKLIASLKEGLATGKSGDSDFTVLLSEMEGLKQEKDTLREQLQNAHIALDSLRREMAELEAQTQNESESCHQQISALEDQLRAEKRHSDDIDFDLTKVKQEMRAMHDDIVKQKAAFHSRLQSRDDEIGRLRNQLVTKSLNVLNQEELESRLRALTESLIQKQTLLESLSTEKNSLMLQLERMDRHCREAESSAVRAAANTVHVSDDDEVRQRLPGFMKQSPLDGNVTRRVKMAAGVVENLGMQLGVFLRRYPVARVSVILYMGLLHFWVMIVLLTYQPEMHRSDRSLPQEPQPP